MGQNTASSQWVPSVAAAVAAGALSWTVSRWVRGITRARRTRYASTTMRREVERALADIASLPAWDPAHSCVILSGGLDTSVVAEIGRDVLGLKAAFTVLTGDEATDRPYAAAVAQRLGMQHIVLELSLEQLLEQLPWTIRVLHSFDPMTLRNSIAIAAALREAARRGFTCAVTGDGADEIMGGYNFTHRMPDEQWLTHRAHMASVMSFDSVPMGSELGMVVASPYTEPRVVKLALRLKKADCMKVHNGKPLGKMPLRRAFPNVASAWRTKDPIEVGCGSTQLGSRPWLGRDGHFDNWLSEKEFAEKVSTVKQTHGVEIRDREHLAYYKVFLEVFPGGVVPGKEQDSSDPCPKCRYQMSSRFQTFCVTCGHYDAEMPVAPPSDSECKVQANPDGGHSLSPVKSRSWYSSSRKKPHKDSIAFNEKEFCVGPCIQSILWEKPAHY